MIPCQTHSIFFLPNPASSFFFFNDPATTEIYTLSLHDALPILSRNLHGTDRLAGSYNLPAVSEERSEEHTSELQSPMYLVCRLLLEKKKQKKKTYQNNIQLPTNTDHHREFKVSSNIREVHRFLL